MVGGKLQRLIYLNGFIWPEYLPDKPRRSEGCNNLIENPQNWPIFPKILGAIVVILFKELVLSALSSIDNVNRVFGSLWNVCVCVGEVERLTRVGFYWARWQESCKEALNSQAKF